MDIFADETRRHSHASSPARRLVVLALVSLTSLAPLGCAAIERAVVEERVRSVEQTNDQAVLARAALRDKDAGVRTAAVERLTDQTALSEVFRSERVHSIRLKALSKMTDQSELLQIAVGRYDVTTAVGSVAHRRQREYRLLARRGITDPELLMRIIIAGMDSNSNARLFERITDPQALLRIAYEAKVSTDRKAAVEHLTDEEALTRIAMEAGSRELRMAAVNRIASPQRLLWLWAKAKDIPVARKAGSMIGGDDIQRLIENGPTVEVKDRAMVLALTSKDQKIFQKTLDRWRGDPRCEDAAYFLLKKAHHMLTTSAQKPGLMRLMNLERQVFLANRAIAASATDKQKAAAYFVRSRIAFMAASTHRQTKAMGLIDEKIVSMPHMAPEALAEAIAYCDKGLQLTPDNGQYVEYRNSLAVTWQAWTGKKLPDSPAK